ncbi:MAG: trypsin-like peptidase domain-containing protein [Chloroflexota bacterium]
MVTTTTESTGVLLGLSNSMADAVEKAGNSIVAVHARRHSPSTGIHWKSGWFVTADHTLERDENITVTLPDGRSVPAAVAGRDAGTDIAVLKVEAANLPVIEIEESESLRVGHIVLAVARPGEHGVSASWGAVSAIGGPWRTWAGGHIDQLIRPDLTLYPGFSGGPLINALGQVVGINTSGLSRNMTLTLPTSTVHRVVEQLQTRGHIARGYLGLAMQPVRLSDSLVATLELTNNGGLVVVSVEPDGPAETVGIIVGDVVVAIDGTSVSDTETVQGLLGPDRVGKTIHVRIVRGGEPKDLSLTVGERPHRGE